MKKEIHILSLGGGVQSSAMFMMACHGEITPRPEYVIFSDPGNETKATYKHLEWLKEQGGKHGIKVIFTSAGNIIEDTLNGIKNNERFANAPFFVKTKTPIVTPIGHYVLVKDEHLEGMDEDEKERIESELVQGSMIQEELKKEGWVSPDLHKDDWFLFKKTGEKETGEYKESTGTLFRQCTSEYKIDAVQKEIRKQLGYKPRQKVKEKIIQWMGISTDEIQRVKPSRQRWIENRYPLIEKEISRNDCLQWMKRNDYPQPPKSACIICPYHSNDYWRDMKKNDPESFEMAVEFDKKIRHMEKLKGEAYLHRSCKPLGEVDFQENQMEMDFDMFTEECTGMCGL